MEEIDNLGTFLKGIQEKKLYPKNLELFFSGEQIDAEGAKAIAQALASGHCPQGLQLNLSNNQLGTEGVKAIAQALASGCCPQDLRLNLACNDLGYEEAKAIAQALASGRCLQGLQLVLWYNQIGTEGTKALAHALASGHCPEGLRLDYHYRNRIHSKIFNEAWATYYNINKQVKFLKCMTLYHGQRQKNSIISLLPPEMLFEICHYILPATPILAKMTEISTKVFQEQSAKLKLADSSLHAKQFDQVLDAALVANTVTEKAVKIKTAINDYLHQEVKPLVNEKFIKLLSVTLLHKFHLITGNEMHSTTLSPIHHSDEPEGQPPLKKMRL